MPGIKLAALEIYFATLCDSEHSSPNFCLEASSGKLELHFNAPSGECSSQVREVGEKEQTCILGNGVSARLPISAFARIPDSLHKRDRCPAAGLHRQVSMYFYLDLGGRRSPYLNSMSSVILCHNIRLILRKFLLSLISFPS